MYTEDADLVAWFFAPSLFMQAINNRVSNRLCTETLAIGVVMLIQSEYKCKIKDMIQTYYFSTRGDPEEATLEKLHYFFYSRKEK